MGMVLQFYVINRKSCSLTLRYKKHHFPIIFYVKLNLGGHLVSVIWLGGTSSLPWHYLKTDL